MSDRLSRAEHLTDSLHIDYLTTLLLYALGLAKPDRVAGAYFRRSVNGFFRHRALLGCMATITLAVSKAIAGKWLNGLFIGVSEWRELIFSAKLNDDKSGPCFIAPGRMFTLPARR